MRVQTLFLQQSRLKAGRARENVLPQQHHPRYIIPWPSAVLWKSSYGHTEGRNLPEKQQTPKNRLPTYSFSGAAGPALLLSLCKDGTGPCKSPMAYKGFVRRVMETLDFQFHALKQTKVREIQEKAASKPNTLSL